MNNREKILIVIPAYNEEKNIAKVVAGIRSALSVDILVVDDGSPDDTAEVAKQAGAKVVIHPFNIGYGAALQTGYKYALRNGYNYVVQLDGDGQHDPKCILDLIKEIKQRSADVVLGSRFLGKCEYKIPLARKVGIKLFRSLTSFIIRQRISDPLSGFQALNRSALKLYSTDIFPADFPDADMLITVHRAGLKIREVPVTMHGAYNQESMHGGLAPFYYVYKMLLSIAVTLMRKRVP